MSNFQEHDSPKVNLQVIYQVIALFPCFNFLVQRQGTVSIVLIFEFDLHQLWTFFRIERQ